MVVEIGESCPCFQEVDTHNRLVANPLFRGWWRSEGSGRDRWDRSVACTQRGARARQGETFVKYR